MKEKRVICGKFLEPVGRHRSLMHEVTAALSSSTLSCVTPRLTSNPRPPTPAADPGPDRRTLPPSRVKELTVDPNRVMEVGRTNVHAVNNMDLLNMEWLSISPQRDDLKLLCEQNVSA